MNFSIGVFCEKYHMQVTHTINVWDYGREIGNLKKLIQANKGRIFGKESERGWYRG